MRKMADTSFEARFYNELRDWLNREGHADAQQVTYIDSDKVSAGYGCDTCDYDVMVIEITYIETGTGRSRYYEYTGGMGELLRELG
jgi:hypothetical protein